MTNKDTANFVKKLKERQESQRLLVQAVEDLNKEKHQLMMQRLKYLFVGAMFVGAIGFTFAALAPVVKSLVAEVGVSISNMFTFSDTKKSTFNPWERKPETAKKDPAEPAKRPKPVQPAQPEQEYATTPPKPLQPTQTEPEYVAQAPNPAPPVQAAQPTTPAKISQPHPVNVLPAPVILLPLGPENMQQLIALPVVHEAPAVAPSPRQRAEADTAWIARQAPAPVKTDFREAPLPVAKRLSTAAFAPAPAAQPTPASYRSLTDLPPGLQELDKRGKQGY